jgi:hypothetical protein
MQGVILSVSVGFLFLLVFLGALVEFVRTVPGTGAIAWIVFGSALMFMTALNVALGLDIAGGPIVGADPASTYALHTAAFLLAAPAAFAGATFFVAIAVFAWESRAFPRWTAWIAVVGVLANAGAVFGILTLTGPLNSGNGIVGHCRAPRPLLVVGVHRQRVVATPRPNQLWRNFPISRAVCSGWSSMTSTYASSTHRS